ncbi:CsbD family protein [Methylobacterium sp. WSM2598]|uniref:CsbD family protein n=1 Tax=Methylobacterium sp. WSM2598 TaxID=398261 RepID=UPI00036FF54C|nr:CsbD family protein [Methylobacterium sp. WSM2598]
MNSDGLHGGARHLKGRAQTVLGGLTGDPGRQVRGAVNQVLGGAQSAYGQARDRAEDWIDDGAALAGEARSRGAAYGRRALRHAENHRAATLVSLAALAFAAGWLTRGPRRAG